jgi:hypothetical protein
VLEAIKASDTKDPVDNEYYTYLINANKSSFQLMTYLENTVAYSKINQSYARDYKTRIPKTT